MSVPLLDLTHAAPILNSATRAGTRHPHTWGITAPHSLLPRSADLWSFPASTAEVSPF